MWRRSPQDLATRAALEEHLAVDPVADPARIDAMLAKLAGPAG